MKRVRRMLPVSNSASVYRNVQILKPIPSQAGNYTVRIVKDIHDYGNSVEGSFAWIEW